MSEGNEKLNDAMEQAIEGQTALSEAEIEKLLDRAKELGMKHLAITDHGAMYGVIDFYQAAKDRGMAKSEFYKLVAND